MIYSGFTHVKWQFIADLPIENGWMFHSYVKVYQRVVRHLSLLSFLIKHKQKKQPILGAPWGTQKPDPWHLAIVARVDL